MSTPYILSEELDILTEFTGPKILSILSILSKKTYEVLKEVRHLDTTKIL
jgi:hypothetical protein